MLVNQPVEAISAHAHVVSAQVTCDICMSCDFADSLCCLHPPVLHVLFYPCAQSWRSDRLKHLPEMRFVYEEEAAPEEFFVPFCWSLAVATTGNRLMSWNLGAVALLTQLSGVDVTTVEGALEQRWSEDAFHLGEMV